MRQPLCSKKWRVEVKTIPSNHISFLGTMRWANSNIIIRRISKKKKTIEEENKHYDILDVVYEYEIVLFQFHSNVDNKTIKRTYEL